MYRAINQGLVLACLYFLFIFVPNSCCVVRVVFAALWRMKMTKKWQVVIRLSYDLAVLLLYVVIWIARTQYTLASIELDGPS